MNAAPHESTAERAQWRTHRQQLDALRPRAFFTEAELAVDGELATVATLILTNRECPWRCTYCDLWKNTTLETVPAGAIPAQIDYALSRLKLVDSSPSAQPVASSGERRQVKLYNAGSFFDPKAIPPSELPAIAERVRSFGRVIVESHPSLVGAPALHFRDLIRPACLEIAMGLEVADDALLAKLNKRMTSGDFRRAAAFLVENGIAVRAFIMLKPPFVMDEARGADLARQSIDFAFDCGASVVVVIPARGGPAELARLAEQGLFSPPELSTFESVLDYGVGLGRGRVFGDLWDLDRVFKCSPCAAARRNRLEQINLSQSLPPKIVCELCR
jgi:hypothetical protein